jgi:tetratricopeptide (TPR) repeat protein
MRSVLDWRRVGAGAGLVLLLAGCAGPPSRSAAVSPAGDPAREAELQGRYLEALIGKQPRHWGARVRLANLRTAAGRDAEAFELLRAASATVPRDVGLYAALAEAAAAVDRLDWTLFGWRQVVRAAPGDAIARLKLAQLYRRLGWNQDASRQLAIAVQLAPGALPVLREQASFSAVVGPPPAARRWAERLLKQHPEAPYGYSLLADLAAEGRRWREAVAYGQEAARRAPRDPTFLVRLAQYQLTRTDPPDPQSALSTLDQALAVDAEDLPAHYWRGVVLRRLGQPREAQAELEQVYRKDPAYEAVTLQLAELSRVAGDAARADQLLNQYTRMQADSRRRRETLTQLVLRPLSADAHLRMARVHLEEGECGQALVEFLTAQRLDPHLQPARDGVAEALGRQGRDQVSLAPLAG